MGEFYKGCASVVLICLVLFISFLVATIALDTVARCKGYYAEGINEEQELFDTGKRP